MGSVRRLFRGRRRPAGSHLQVDVFSLCSASVIHSIVLVADEVAAIMDPHKSRVVFVATTSVVVWSLAQALAPLIVRLLNAVGSSTLAGAAAIAIAAGLALVGGAVQARNPDLFPLLLGWAGLIGVGCSVLQVSTFIQARLHFSTRRSGDDHSSGSGKSAIDADCAKFESLTFVWAFLLIFFHHIQIALCGLTVHRVLFNQSILCLLIAVMTILNGTGDDSCAGRAKTHQLSSRLLHRDWKREGRRLGHGSGAGLPTSQPRRWRGAIEGGRGAGAPGGKAVAVECSSGGGGGATDGATSKGKGLLTPARARNATNARPWQHFSCLDSRWAYPCAVHALIMTPMMSTLILMPMALRVLFSPPLALRNVGLTMSSPTTVLIGLVTYGACQALTLALRRSMAMDSVYACVSGVSSLAFLLTPLLASEQTHALFVAAQCLQVSLIAPMNHLMPDFVGGFVSCGAATDACMGAIRAATAVGTFAVVVLGAGALGIPFFTTTVHTDPVFIEKNVRAYFVSLAFMQLLAIAAIRLQKALGRPAPAKQQEPL